MFRYMTIQFYTEGKYDRFAHIVRLSFKIPSSSCESVNGFGSNHAIADGQTLFRMIERVYLVSTALVLFASTECTYSKYDSSLAVCRLEGLKTGTFVSLVGSYDCDRFSSRHMGNVLYNSSLLKNIPTLLVFNGPMP